MKQIKPVLGVITMALLGFILFWMIVPHGTSGLKLGMDVASPPVLAPTPVPTVVASVRTIHVTLVEFFAGF